MAVSTKTLYTADTNSGLAGRPMRAVHYVKVGKGNRKGTATLIGGVLKEHLGKKEGDFHIVLDTKVNGKEKTLKLHAGDVVFKTDSSNRWQVLTLKGFRKRFPETRI